MKVKEFVEKYNTLKKNDAALKTFLQSVCPKEKQYISYARKLTICEKIVETTYYQYDRDENGNKTNIRLHVNSASTYMLYMLNLVREYTIIEIDFTNSIEEFDLLNKDGILDLIMNTISERELKEFQMILNMVEDDTMTNEYETHAFVRNQVELFGRVAGVSLAPVLETLGKQIENLDEKKLDKILSKLSR